jgi:hypothetical protein
MQFCLQMASVSVETSSHWTEYYIRYLVVCASDIQQMKCDDKSNKSYNIWSRLEVECSSGLCQFSVIRTVLRISTLYMSPHYLNVEAGEVCETFRSIRTREWLMMKQNIPGCNCLFSQIFRTTQCYGLLVVIEICWYKCWIKNVMLHNKLLSILSHIFLCSFRAISVRTMNKNTDWII